MSEFTEMAEHIKECASEFLKATAPSKRMQELSMLSGEIAAEIHDLDYISTYCRSLETLVSNERQRKYHAYLHAKATEAIPLGQS